MAYEIGDIKDFNVSKEIRHNVDLPMFIQYRLAATQARTGSTPIKSHHDMSDNERRINQVKGLTEINSAMRQIIDGTASRVKRKSKKRWEKQNSSLDNDDDEWEKDETTDYFKLKELKSFLKFAHEQMRIADETTSLEDDFSIEADIDGKKVVKLTDNYYNMLEDLEDAHEVLDDIMSRCGIDSMGMHEDEELTYKEQELAFIEAVKEA